MSAEATTASAGSTPNLLVSNESTRLKQSGELPEAGHHLFADIFRRADKKDLGYLSKEEFYEYFRDGLLSKADLEEMFKTADKDHSGGIDMEELIGYFKQGFQPFARLFAALESIHLGVTDLLAATAKDYSSQGFLEQYRTRFFLREFMTSLLSLERPVQAAVSKLEKITSETSNRPLSYETRETEIGARALSRSSPAPDDVLTQLKQQVQRMSVFIDTLEKKPISFGGSEDDSDASEAEALSPTEAALVVTRRMTVLPAMRSEFAKLIGKYLKQVRKEGGCQRAQVVRAEHPDAYVVYEVWAHEREYLPFLHSAPFKEHLRQLLDVLVLPEAAQQIRIPNSWVRSQAS